MQADMSSSAAGGADGCVSVSADMKEICRGRQTTLLTDSAWRNAAQDDQHWRCDRQDGSAMDNQAATRDGMFDSAAQRAVPQLRTRTCYI